MSSEINWDSLDEFFHKPVWSIEEAVNLIYSRYPWDGLSPSQRLNDSYKVLSDEELEVFVKIKSLQKVLQLACKVGDIENAVNIEDSGWHVRPISYLKWVQKKGSILIPDELTKKVAKHYGGENELGTSERHTLYKIIIALALHTSKNRSEKPWIKLIEDTFKRKTVTINRDKPKLDRGMTDDTIRKYLNLIDEYWRVEAGEGIFDTTNQKPKSV